MTRSIFILLFFILSSCARKYKKTEKLCNENIYLEVFDRYPDCRDYYLTDSNNFRTFFLAQDLEHDFFKYDCKKDTIFLIKVETGNKNCREYRDSAGRMGFVCDKDTVVNTFFLISKLIAEKKFE